ncbi:hypothetical protein [Undibacter mobilis]|uniref:Uncharacterized protein n=1 Tax=Undibacter mobilis TaxID=2292256 RepID=A0A371B9J1_9BRAD|nr:hypothetical protein [Undibacter mobilis]RDV04248.1 hypothetical protein DXH78_06405 [Undibacter mobilis]
MRRWLRPLWVFLALLFLLEAWLWDHLSPVVARIVGFIPWAALKQRLAQAIERLSPWATLIVFVLPLVVLLLPLKFIEVYFLATGQWLGAIAVIVVAKLVGVGVTAFIFDATRDKLLQMAWFRALYEWMLRVRAWAHAVTEPVRVRMRDIAAMIRSARGGRFLRWLSRLRRAAFRRAA